MVRSKQGLRTVKVSASLAVVSQVGIQKIQTLLEMIVANPSAIKEVCFFTGTNEVGANPHPDLVKIYHYPGAHNFELRSKLCAAKFSFDAVILVEDHNVIDREWLTMIDEIMDKGPLDHPIQGLVTNHASVTLGGWSSFLATGALLSKYSYTDEVKSVIPYNLIIPTTKLPKEDQPDGYFEFQLLETLCQVVEVKTDLLIGHEQHLNVVEAMIGHWSNGCSAGWLTRTRGKTVLPSIKYVLAYRVPFLLRNLNTRRQPNLPLGTKALACWLMLVHSCGLIWGARFGAGRAFWRLE